MWRCSRAHRHLRMLSYDLSFRPFDLFRSDRRWISPVRDGYTTLISKFLGGLERQGLSKVEDSVPSGSCLLSKGPQRGRGCRVLPKRPRAIEALIASTGVCMLLPCTDGMLGYAPSRHTLLLQWSLRPPLENPAVVVGCRPQTAPVSTSGLAVSTSCLYTIALCCDDCGALADVGRRLRALHARAGFMLI